MTRDMADKRGESVSKLWAVKTKAVSSKMLKSEEKCSVESQLSTGKSE